MLAFNVLYRDETVSIARYLCRAPAGDRSGEEASAEDAVSFVCRGSFVVESGRGRSTADARQAVFFNRHEPYRVAHPHGGGDECVVVALSAPEQAAWLAGRDRGRRRGDHAAFPWPAALTGEGAPLVLHALLARVSGGDASAPEVQARAFDLLAQVRLPDADEDGGRRERDRVEEARLLLAGRLGDPSPLRTAAAALGLSHFHLCRLFRRRLGISVHQYVLGLRLRTALARLAGGQADLTALALDLGFADHSHFTRTFRRAYGTTPSAWRRAVRPPRGPGRRA